MSTKAIIKTLISVLCLVGSALAIYNVESDNRDVIRMAEREVCNESCVKTVRVERGPISQVFAFQTSLQPPEQAEVKCTRQFLLVGAYSCRPLR